MFCKQLLPRFGGVFFCLFTALSAVAGPYANTIKGPTQITTVTVTVVWLEPTAVDAVCSFLLGVPAAQKLAGCYNPLTKTIYAPEPRSFEDYYRLMLLGHEFWHALGADHPDINAPN